MYGDGTPESQLTEKDLDVLRRWLLRVTNEERIKAQELLRAKPNSLPGGSISVATLKRILDSTDYMPSSTSRQRMRWLWRYLSEVPRYARHFPGNGGTRGGRTRQDVPADDLMSSSLAEFFAGGERVAPKVPPDRLRQVLPGRYVLYRPDLEPAQRDNTPADLIRASLLEIQLVGESISIVEKQDFPRTPLREAQKQANNGVVSPYGHFLIALLRSDSRVSFKCMVINHWIPAFAEGPLVEFRGKLFVASELSLFPAIRIFCQRIAGKEFQHGIYPPDQVHPDIVEYLRTPTFKPRHNVTV